MDSALGGLLASMEALHVSSGECLPDSERFVEDCIVFANRVEQATSEFGEDFEGVELDADFFAKLSPAMRRLALVGLVKEVGSAAALNINEG